MLVLSHFRWVLSQKRLVLSQNKVGSVTVEKCNFLFFSVLYKSVTSGQKKSLLSI